MHGREKTNEKGETRQKELLNEPYQCLERSQCQKHYFAEQIGFHHDL